MDWTRDACGATKNCWLQYLSKAQQKAIERHWDKAVEGTSRSIACPARPSDRRYGLPDGLGLFKDAIEYREAL